MNDRQIQIQDSTGATFQIAVSVPQETLNQVASVVAFLSALPSGGSTDAKARAMLLVNALDGLEVTKEELWESAKIVARRCKFYPAPSEITKEIYEIRQRKFNERRFGIPIIDDNGEVRIRLVSEEEFEQHEMDSLESSTPETEMIKELPEMTYRRMPV